MEMTITYKPMDGMPSVRIPILHKVVYAYTVDHVQAFYQRSYLDHLVDEWLEKNCKHSYYHGPGYLEEKFIQFECDEDALLFALKWGR
jgi:hypothetical protein